MSAFRLSWIDRLHYGVVSQEAHEKGEERVIHMNLQLLQFEIPACTARTRQVRCVMPDALEQLRPHEGSLRSVTLVFGNGPDPTYAQGEFLEGRCPYCGHEEELVHNRWCSCDRAARNLLDEETGEVTVAHGNEYGSFFIREEVPFKKMRELDFRSIACWPEIAAPYGSEPPLQGLAWHLLHPQLSGIEEAQAPRAGGPEAIVFGNTKNYQGYYACSACGNCYFVETVGSGGRFSAVVPLQNSLFVSVEIRANGKGITLRFDPPVSAGRCEELCLRLDDGNVEVDGQLAREEPANAEAPQPDAGPSACETLAMVSYGFICHEMVDAVQELLARNYDSPDSLEQCLSALGKTKIATWRDSRLMDLAFANRFRGYPDQFYEKAYALDRNLQYGLLYAWRAGSVLPMNYEECDAAYRASCLPNVESVRRVAFGQPWIIALAHRLERIPFEDVNILVRLLEHPSAFRMLDGLQGLQKGQKAALDYLVELYGEPKALMCLMYVCCLRGGIGSLGRQVPRLSDRVVAQLKKLGVQGAADALAALASDALAGSSGALDSADLFAEYEYPEQVKALEGEVRGFRFTLPDAPWDYITAGVQLHNCLRKYAVSASDETVLLVHRGEKLVGAVGVHAGTREVVQAYAACNCPVENVPGFAEALAEWTKM